MRMAKAWREKINKDGKFDAQHDRHINLMTAFKQMREMVTLVAYRPVEHCIKLCSGHIPARICAICPEAMRNHHHICIEENRPVRFLVDYRKYEAINV